MQTQQPKKILIVDDEKDIRNLMQEIFSDEGYDVQVAANGVQARNAWRNQIPDLIFLDVWMPDVDGVNLLKEMKEEKLLEHSAVVMISGHGTIETAIEATKIGAYDFMEKPLSLTKLLTTAQRALKHQQLRNKHSFLKTKQPDLVMPAGISKTSQDLRENIERLAKYTMPVLITGETGVGKHWFARSVHYSSNRNEQPFLRISARKFSEDLAQWVGVQTTEQNVVGKIETLGAGTLVLSNIENLSPEAQETINCLIFEQAYKRQGSDRLHPIDLRIIATATANLAEKVAAGEFLEKLYERFKVTSIQIPALRQRSEDIPALIEDFMREFSQKSDLTTRVFPPEVLNDLRQQAWPGNLNELKNLVHRLLILNSSAEVSLDEIHQKASPCTNNEIGLDTSIDLKTARDLFESTYLKQLLRETGGSVSEVAKRSGMERTHLYRKMKNLNIDPKDPL